MEIIPAIDIIDGKCVRLTQGAYSSKKVYNDNPLEVAKMFEGWGIRRLHLVDLDGARTSHIVNYPVLNKISSLTSLIVDFGGGLKSTEDVKIAFENGASMITGGSIAVKDSGMFLSWLDHYGSEKVILGADHRQGKISISGWKDNSQFELFDFISTYTKKGITKIISTDIEKDGMLKGPSFNTYQEILQRFPDLHLIASGGVAHLNDLVDLEKIGVNGVILGKAIYEGKISEKDLIPFINN
jgi:phosphoribosylformimino-5-aminoimidazole carboxamide ribotide isomerase